MSPRPPKQLIGPFLSTPAPHSRFQRSSRPRILDSTLTWPAPAVANTRPRPARLPCRSAASGVMVLRLETPACPRVPPAARSIASLISVARPIPMTFRPVFAPTRVVARPIIMIHSRAPSGPALPVVAMATIVRLARAVATTGSRQSTRNGAERRSGTRSSHWTPMSTGPCAFASDLPPAARRGAALSSPLVFRR
jgi:hypothetical protein